VTDALWVEPGRYVDSVTLMRASAAAKQLAGVATVIAAMATDLNRSLLGQAGFAVPDVSADDLVIAVRAGGDAEVAAAREAVERVLTERRPGTAGGVAEGPALTVESAARRRPDAGVVLVSVPGPHAAVEALAALGSGRHVMVFSDNVPVEAEVALKRVAAERGRLVMGPDCGTVILGGVGLGFANVVVPGPVGLVAASGTGAQQVCCLLDGAGVGVRHVLGVGGRDLSIPVGGASTLAALAALDADPATEVVAVVSKPPDPEVADAVERAAAACRTPVVLAFVGPGRPDLTDAAARIAAAAGADFPEPASWGTEAADASPGPIVGLFSGGTNCAEAQAVIGAPPEASVLVDLGDDAFTAGRPHPMIDPAAVGDRLAAEAPAAGVVLLDVVLGHGAHPDPAAVLAPAIAGARDAGAAVVVALVGAAGDPQGLDRQALALTAAGAAVHRSVARAAALASALAAGAPAEVRR
jgi:FdrA protein